MTETYGTYFRESALKPLLRGEPRHRGVPALLAGTKRASGVGGTCPPRLSPGGGNGKGGDQTSLLPQAVRAGLAPMAGTPLLECVFVLPLFSPSTTDRSIRSIRFPEILPALPPTPLPCFYPHSEWAAMGPVQVGVRSQAQVHHHRDGPGWLGAAIYWAISEGSASLTQSPEQGGGCLCLPKLLEVCLPPRHQLMLALLPNLASLRAVARNGSAWVGLLLALGRLRSLPHFRRRPSMV